ncbi:succinyl-diaminopimelate desuccinylase [Rarobacter faecitabidus]|uniref:Succinyl-diaminopimelate desuccinylase n=1 Tax=Rarobacter faecitabidus TaxID=13243 RepID=A0A542ZUJ7_RARFA|nr:succinyl-diaminopimelate desuccinylase [Rarobacter faecitabidus]TQL64045.1 succinyldiaminopimelate desuccinylase [Rarobacter faecitabidus]
MASIDLTASREGLRELVQALCDTESVSGNEAHLADEFVAALHAAVGGRVAIHRIGNNVVATTNEPVAQRVVLAGHLDTVPVASNLPTRLIDEGTANERIWGRGTVDMKAGLAVLAQVFVDLVASGEPLTRNLTLVAYENEEVAAHLNGLGHLVRDHPGLLAADFAVLGEPSNGGIEGGCNGTVRVHVHTRGKAAHSARAWMGENAIHAAAPILAKLAEFTAQTVPVDGLDYRESLSAVAISGGIAGNVIPDHCVVTVNYRFAPAKSADEAITFLRGFFAPFEITVDDAAGGARPGLDQPIAQDFVRAVSAITGGGAAAKVGWTDVARFAELGTPAVNFGPGDPLLAHHDDEQVASEQVTLCYDALHSWLTGANTSLG